MWKLAPDVGGYHTTLNPPTKTNFPAMEIFVEFKENNASNPFQDDTTSPSFLCESEDSRTTRGQIASYVAAMSGSQFRLHIFAVIIFGTFARLMFWDKAGTIITKKFNYIATPFLVNFLQRFNSLSSKQCGYDPSVKPCP
ncbi:hypothetical protein B0H34DRAFT_648436, partial [Crassisporium funariophilum]